MPTLVTRTVYRVEYADGLGVYTGGGVVYNLREAVHGGRNTAMNVNICGINPAPCEDGIAEWTRPYPLAHVYSNFVFGFRSLRQFWLWFGDIAHLFEECGVVLKAYEIPRCAVLLGKRQIAFPRQAILSESLVPLAPVVAQFHNSRWRQYVAAKVSAVYPRDRGDSGARPLPEGV